VLCPNIAQSETEPVNACPVRCWTMLTTRGRLKGSGVFDSSYEAPKGQAQTNKDSRPL
jgi:hypothetical protein